MQKITWYNISMIGIGMMLVFGVISIAVAPMILAKSFDGELDTQGVLENTPFITLPLTLIGILMFMGGMIRYYMQ